LADAFVFPAAFVPAALAGALALLRAFGLATGVLADFFDARAFTRLTSLCGALTHHYTKQPVA
jgi:hypothetical protein